MIAIFFRNYFEESKMADLLDNEAMESENDDDMSGDEDMNASRRNKKRQLDSSDEDDDEDDEERAREEMKGFIQDDVDEESEDEGRRRKKKKKRRRRSSSGSGSSGSGSSRSRSRSRSRRRSDDEDLDEDDMDLIEENLGVKIKKKRSRIQIGSSDEGSGSGSDDGDLPDPERRGRDSAASRETDEEDLSSFIVDEEGRPIERKKTKRKHIFEDSQRQLAEDIFGVAFDYDEFDQYDEKSDVSESDEYDEEDDEERIRKKERKKKRPTKTIFDIFDPHDLAVGHYTDLDQEIRGNDVPERMQLRQIPVTAVPEESDELDRESEWIFKHGFTKPTLTEQHDYKKDDCDDWNQKTATVEKIKKVNIYFCTIWFLKKRNFLRLV